MAIRRPFNLKQWITENRDLLKPPVGNKNLYADAGDYIVMIVAGPNMRKDYHYNETEELYYQLEGDINVKIQEHEPLKSAIINFGDYICAEILADDLLFLLPVWRSQLSWQVLPACR